MVEVAETRTVDVLIITKKGVKIAMPDIATAKRYTTGIWKGKVERIEIKSVIDISEADN